MQFLSFVMQSCQHKTYEKTIVGEINRALHIQKSVAKCLVFLYKFFIVRDDYKHF